jgi:hypothetical protein
VAITLVGENEQSTFAEIEKLLGKPVNKAKIPAQLGSGPEYQPGKRRSVNRKRSFDRKKRKF